MNDTNTKNWLAASIKSIENKDKKKAIINEIKSLMVEQLAYSEGYVTQVTLNMHIKFSKRLEICLLKKLPKIFASQGLEFKKAA